MLTKLKADLAIPRQQHRRSVCSLDNDDDENYGYSPEVLIHGWERRRLQVRPVTHELLKEHSVRCLSADMVNNHYNVVR